MINYNVIIHISTKVEKEWLSWMKTIHIPEIMSLNIFTKSKILKIVNSKKRNIKSYCITYECISIEDYNQYKKKYSKNIQTKHSEKYEGQFTAERLILSLQNEF